MNNNASTSLEIVSPGIDPQFLAAVNDRMRRIQSLLEGQATPAPAASAAVNAPSGGQYSIQVEGPLAIQTNAAPPLVIDATQSAVDVTAYVNAAPTGAPVVLQVMLGTVVWAGLTIPDGALLSNTVAGASLAQLTQGSRLSLNITSVPSFGSPNPGVDLTVTIRL
jgi:hypothetical protein